MDDSPHVTVRRDGPYDVVGAPLVRTAQVETEYGEPIDWEHGASLKARHVYSLCRCGRSRRKPFCDESHKEEPWDSTETADRSPRSTRADVYPGVGVVMTDDRSLCTQAGYCGDRFRKVWDMIDDTADSTIRDRLERMVSLCPSGALDYAPARGVGPVEPPFEPTIAVVRDGPLWVRGGIPIESEDGTPWEVRNRVTLCRCGQSKNKPFCDGTHKEIGFREG